MADRLTRLIRIYNRLKRGPLTIEMTVKWAHGAGIDVSERQLYRDLNTLQHLQIASGENVVEFNDEKNKKTWKLEYDSESEAITDYDINSFYLFKSFVPGNIQQHRIDALEKFEKILYKNFSKNSYRNVAEASELYLRRTSYRNIIYGQKEHGYLEDFLWALQNKRVISITNSKVNASNINFEKYELPMQFYPMEMLFHDGQVYMAGLEASSGKVLTYMINKHLSFSLTNEVFNRKKISKQYRQQIDNRFALAEPIGDKIHRISIEFTGDYGLAVREVFLHPSATWKTLKNGNYMLQMKCCINRELVGFLGYSLDKVKVHQPKVLKDLVLKKLKDTLELYSGKEIDEERANKDY